MLVFVLYKKSNKLLKKHTDSQYPMISLVPRESNLRRLILREKSKVLPPPFRTTFGYQISDTDADMNSTLRETCNTSGADLRHWSMQVPLQLTALRNWGLPNLPRDMGSDVERIRKSVILSQKWRSQETVPRTLKGNIHRSIELPMHQHSGRNRDSRIWKCYLTRIRQCFHKERFCLCSLPQTPYSHLQKNIYILLLL